MRAGQTKRTPALEKRLVDALRLGATDTLACQYAGISTDTLSRWQHASAAFAAVLTRARGELGVGLLATIEQAARLDWRAAAWKLERRWPQDYGRQILTLEGDAANPLAVLHAMPEADLDALIQRRLREAGLTPTPPDGEAPDGG